MGVSYTGRQWVFTAVDVLYCAKEKSIFNVRTSKSKHRFWHLQQETADLPTYR